MMINAVVKKITHFLFLFINIFVVISVVAHACFNVVKHTVNILKAALKCLTVLPLRIFFSGE